MTNTEQGHSGSENSHSRLAPSAAKRWTECTASVKFIEENDHLIFPTKLAKVVRLTPYLKDLPEDEIKDYELRAIQIADDVHNKRRTVESLTSDERKDIERAEGSVASRKGTRVHDFAEAILNGRRSIESVPSEFQECLRIYIDHCKSLVPEGFSPMVEAQVPLFYSASQKDKGTSDFVVILPDRVIIRDYKNGGGEEEFAENNKQLSIYAYSVVKLFDDIYGFTDDTIVDLGIVQPNHHAGNAIKTWGTTVKDLREFCQDIEDAARVIREGVNTKFSPTDNGCLWCDAKAFCSARHESINTALMNPEITQGRDLVSVMPDLTKEEKKLPVEDRIMARLGIAQPVSEDTLVAMYAAKSRFEGLLDDVEEYLTKRALSGNQAAGTKLVLSREGNRKWRNDDEADVFLKGQGLKADERYDYTIKSPAKVEALLKDKLATSKRTASRFETLISRSEAKKVLTLETDKRQAVGAEVEGFENECLEDGFEP